MIHLLLDVGVDIDRLNCEGMSALAVCHVLHYHLQSRHDTITEPAAVNQAKFRLMRFVITAIVLLLALIIYNEKKKICHVIYHQVFESPNFSQGDLSIETPRRRPETVNTILDSQTNHSHLPDEYDSSCNCTLCIN